MTISPETSMHAVLEALWADRGKPRRGDGDDVLGLLVRMLLGQATSKPNAAAAFGTLVDRFAGDWARIHRAEVGEIAAAIEVGGLARQKAPRIQRLLGAVHERFGDYTLEPLREWDVTAALDFLLGLDGVGPTTARFTLMVGAGMDVFPMNGGIRRILTRVGVLRGDESDLVAHEHVQSLMRAGDAYAAHMVLVQHARAVCRPTPRCAECAARAACAFAAR